MTRTTVARRHKDSYGQYYDKFWTREIGGLPGWALVLAGGVLLALGAMIAVLLLSPQ